MQRKKIGLVLSGGGQGGWVQLGALQVLEENKIPFDIIVGTSVGGLIGWGLATGLTVKKLIKKSDIIREQDFKGTSSDPYSIYDPSVAFKKLEKLLGDKNIEDLPKKFAVTAVDLWTGEEIIINKGSAVKAVKATTCIPTVFPPVKFDGRLLVDGGVLNVLPVDVAYSMGAEVTIAIDVSNFGKSVFDLKKTLNPAAKRIIETTKNPLLAAILKKNYLFESLYETVRIMGNRIRNERLTKTPPTVLLEEYFVPDYSLIAIDDTKQRKKLMDIGRKDAKQSIAKIKEALVLTEPVIA